MAEGSRDGEEFTTIDVAPSGRIVETLARREAIPSVKEQIDNAIDAARRYNRTVDDEAEKIKEAEIHVNYSTGDEDSEAFVEVKDTCGGVTEGDQQKVLRPGSSSTESEETGSDLPDAIGWAGVGAIRGAMSIGREVTFFSRGRGEEQGYKATVTMDDYTSDNTEVPLEPVDIEAGTSKIRIGNLTIDPVDDFSGSIEHDDLADLDHGGALIEELASTYALFLGGEFPGMEGLEDDDDLEPELDLEIYVNRTRVNDFVESADYDWSFVPMDGLHPRTIANYRLEPDDIEGLDGELRVDFTVGLLREKDSSKMGVTLYANRRKILDADTSKALKRKFHFNKFNTITQGRLCILVSVRSLESPEHIPTTDQKDTLNFDFDATKEMMKAVGRLAVEYQRHAKNQDLPGPITRAYPSGHPQGSNNGKIEAHNYKNRRNITDKPGEPGSGRYNDFPAYPRVRDAIKRDAQLGIYCPSDLAPEYRPAYTGITPEIAEEYGLEETKGYYKDQFDNHHDESDYFDDGPVGVDRCPPSEYDLNQALDYLEELARRHADSDRQCLYTELPEYEAVYYKSRLVHHGADLDELERIDQLPKEEQRENLLDDNGDSNEPRSYNGSSPEPRAIGVLSESAIEEHISSSQREVLEDAYLPEERDDLIEATEEDLVHMISELLGDKKENEEKIEELRENFEEVLA